jgi:methanogenic corrinoid protein MtbC1
MSSGEEIWGKLAQAVIDGEPEDAADLAKQALDQGLDPLTCINEGLTAGINRVGELFASGEYYLPDLIIGGEAMKAALAILEPAMVGKQGRDVLGRVVLGTVEGDLHEIGKTLVGASALLTTTMPEQQKIIEALREAGLRDRVKVMVGGAPVTQSWAEKIGADGHAEDAIGAVAVAKKLVGAA